MAITLTSNQARNQTDDIVVGYGHLKGLRDRNGSVYWALPAGGRITEREHAEEYAARLDRMIRVNKQLSGRDLTWT